MKRLIPHWRKMTWTIVAWSGLMLAWIIGASSSANCGDQVGSYQNAQQSGCEAGTAIGVGLVIFLWFLGFIVLSLIWFMSRPRET